MFYSATATVAGGKTGIFVVPSTNMTAAPVFITTDTNAQVRAFSYNVTLSGTKVTARSPARMMYTALGSDSKIHMYGIDLTATTAAPAPFQAGSLALASSTVICEDTSSASDNLLLPNTIWVLLHTNTVSSNDCGTGTGDAYQVINYTDSVGTAPISVTLSGDVDIDALYHVNGVLAGIVLEQTTGPTTNLNYYGNKQFTVSSALVPNISSSANLYDVTSNGKDNVGDSVAFYSVTTPSSTQLYRITAAGAATSVYTQLGTGLDVAVDDTSNVWATDADSAFYRIQKVPINAGVAVHKYDADLSLGNISLIGSNDTVLAFTVRPTAGGDTVQTVPVTSGQVFTTSTIATLSAGSSIVNAFMAEATPGTNSTSQIMLNYHNTSTLAKATQVILPSGTVVQAALANSEFEETNEGISNVILQVRGITDAFPLVLQGGAGIYVYTVGTGVGPALTLSGGGAYTIPASSLASIFDIAVTASDEIGEGTVAGGSGSADGLAVDTASHLIVPIHFANTSIIPF